MPIYPGCKQCQVIEGVKELLKEYQYFLTQVENPRFVHMTDHARGNHQGKVSTVQDFISDLKEVIPYLEDETAIRGGR